MSCGRADLRFTQPLPAARTQRPAADAREDRLSVQPVEPVAPRDPAEDPAAIFEVLPPSHRARFRAEYDEALEAAHDLVRFKQVQMLLRQWRLRAIAYMRPGYEVVQDALQDPTEMFTRYTPPEWEGRVRATRSMASTDAPSTS
ncbi:DUF6247 family protein [Microbispora sp. NPDC049125]|uniref:DUF6247 family protein n=1 Tax=Microbispora sp. NPDC049125 TaxID=3154929 RepID=UPI003466A540